MELFITKKLPEDLEESIRESKIVVQKKEPFSYFEKTWNQRKASWKALKSILIIKNSKQIGKSENRAIFC